MSSKCLTVLLAVVCVVAFSGCYNSSLDNMSFNRYYSTRLKVSTSSDVMMKIKAEDEVVSQSGNVISSWGHSNEGKVIWFNAVAFDEDNSTAVRKYGFVSNEKARGWGQPMAQTLRFDAEAVISMEVLDAPYADENAKKIAIIGALLNEFTADFGGVTRDSQTLESSSLMAKQVLKTVLTKLRQSPSLAASLQAPDGMDYEHMNYGAGKIRMIIEGDVVSLKTMTGSTIEDFDTKLDILSM